MDNYKSLSEECQAVPRTLVDPNRIPIALQGYFRFVGWKYVQRPGQAKPDKIPVNCETLGNAGVNWPNTWTDINTAVRTYRYNQHLSGIGYVLTSNDLFTMIDVDGCLIDGQLSALASEIISRLDTYAELSPSGRGLRLFVECPQQPTMKKPEVEIYSTGRWATLTGNVLHDKPIARVDNLDWLIQRFNATPARAGASAPETHTPFSSRHSQRPPADDHKLWQRIFTHNNLAYQLYNGNVSAAYGGDESRAVILLLNTLALWTKGDEARMDRMIRQSSLNSAKFDRKTGDTTWLKLNIANAINYMAGRF